MNDGNTKQQITDRIKNATNILVTVSTNPTVDELSAALGLTLMLNKLDKHATAVFSGEVPPAISFLDPSKTFENTVDSLRDFIIALDKEKADRLRYRVEDDVVRIFITPYRTRITEEDLKFTHGDFNVELVLALGVENKEVLDNAIAAHGRILHDATVATINAQNKTSTLGSIDWQDTNASSLCEMLVSVGESLQAGLLDEQIATALLTGIVAATNRFSNEQTSPKSMTMAAQLMAAGANQQLIAAKLEESDTISSSEPATEKDGSSNLDEGASKKIRDKKDKKKSSDKKNDGSLGEMTVSHEDRELPTEDAAPAQSANATIEEHDQHNKQAAGEAALDEALAKLDAATPTTSTVPDLEKELEQTTQAPTPLDVPQSEASSKGNWRDQALSEPSMGGTLSATTDEAHDEKLREEESNRNKVIMSHDSPPVTTKAKTITPPSPTLPVPSPAVVSATSNSPAATLAQIEEEMHKSAAANEPFQPPTDQVNTAEQQVSDILNDPSLEAPIPQPAIPQSAAPADSMTLPPPPPLPDFSTLPPLPSSQPVTTTPPPLDANGLPLPVVPTVSTETSQATTSPAPSAPEPGQFRIPGQ